MDFLIEYWEDLIYGLEETLFEVTRYHFEVVQKGFDIHFRLYAWYALLSIDFLGNNIETNAGETLQSGNIHLKRLWHATNSIAYVSRVY